MPQNGKMIILTEHLAMVKEDFAGFADNGSHFSSLHSHFSHLIHITILILTILGMGTVEDINLVISSALVMCNILKIEIGHSHFCRDLGVSDFMDIRNMGSRAIS